MVKVVVVVVVVEVVVVVVAISHASAWPKNASASIQAVNVVW